MAARGTHADPGPAGQLSALTGLDMADRSGLQQLPGSLGQLSAPRSLDLHLCSRLMPNLTSLDPLIRHG
jgi:hypothetical protein